MHWHKIGYYAGCAATLAVCVLSAWKLIDYYGDVRSSKHQLDEAKTLYREANQTTQTKALPPFVPIPNTMPVDLKSKSPFAASDRANLPASLTVQERFKTLLQTNSDVVGWLKIDGTTIDYPVLQAEDNAFYLKKDLYRNDNVTGSIFMDYRNHIDRPEYHWIVYGHYMNDEIMFKGLLKYKDEDYYEEHTVISFDTLYGDLKWLIFSVYYTDVNEDYIRTEFADDEQFWSFAGDLKANSLYDTGISVGADDTILTLSTCSRTEEGGRFTVHAKLITATS
ncbi:MAG: class B sortase [Candidatus Cohnella colombiensis]|uniref:Class B sortase n=1 Tax=Candidatus Cohnella colombiensis TaxID=3121368 RepID=A0AA95EWZ7_9BACL|nr:MAG: class B sortase [Cohnella sp.]